MSVYRPKYTDPKTGEVKESGVWWYEFTYQGRRIRESANTTKKTLAKAAMDNRRFQLERAAAGLPAEVAPAARIESVRDAIKRYKTIFAVGHRPKAIRWVADRCAHLDRLMGAELRIDMTESRLRRYMTARLSEGVGNRTINMEVECLARALGFMWRIIWPGLKRLEEREDVGRALSEEEQSAILHQAARNKSPYINLAVRLALTLAMRSDEIRSLRWGNIDLAERVLSVGKSKTKAGERVIPMNGDLLTLFAEHLSWYRSRFGKPLPDWYVFPFCDRVQPIDPTRAVTTLKSAWESIREDAGVSCRFHDLRHSALTRMAENGAPESTMLALAGHMSRAMLERYSHIRMAAKRTAIEAVVLPIAAPLSDGVPKDSPKVRRKKAVLRVVSIAS